MVQDTASRSRAARERLGHPVVDADGHFIEWSPLFVEDLDALVREIGGPDLHARFRESRLSTWDAGGPTTDPRETWRAAAPWWGWPTGNTLDRATVHLPRLLCERLDDFGIDVAVAYPSHGLAIGHGLAFRLALDPELAQAVSRAMNTIYAEMFGPYSHRIVSVASIPMHTPEIAIEELEHAVRVLGFKAIRIAGYAVRPIPRVHRDHPRLLPFVNRYDTFGLDSEHDYDPFWAKCVELGVAPVTHTSLLNQATRSVSSYVYNHINGLAHAHEALCKSLFMGGVTHRFPTLQVGFLEGGVAWACALLSALVGHWEKRNVEALAANLDPELLDVDELVALVERYGDAGTTARADAIRAWVERPLPRPDVLDEWAACGIAKSEDIVAQFSQQFYFGCEPDDRTTVWAFSERVNPHGARLHAMFGSDIAHWDVTDMSATVWEAYELLEDGLLDDAGLRDFVFTNAVRLHAGMNPDFFADTVIADDVRALRETGELDRT